MTKYHHTGVKMYWIFAWMSVLFSSLNQGTFGDSSTHATIDDFSSQAMVGNSSRHDLLDGTSQAPVSDSSESIFTKSNQATEDDIEQAISRSVLNMNNISFSELWSVFAKVCPYDMCSERIEPATVYTGINREVYGECYHNCSCKPDCVLYNACCPSVWFGYLDYECISTSIEGSKRTWYSMINRCPPTIEVEDNTTAPVTSERIHLTYKNTFIANCNGELDMLISWIPTAACFQNSTFSPRISSFADLRYGLINKTCDVRFELPILYMDFLPGSCAGHEYEAVQALIKVDKHMMNFTGSCNVSGTWQHYDVAIDVACQKTNSNYYRFKNPYCYICNPGLANTFYGLTPLITRCNVTGQWVEYNVKLFEECLNGSETPYHLPFKNIHCRMCNLGRQNTKYTGINSNEIWIRTMDFSSTIIADTLLEMFKQTRTNNINLPIYVSAGLENGDELNLDWAISYAAGPKQQCGIQIPFEQEKCNTSLTSCTRIGEIVSCLNENALDNTEPFYDCGRHFRKYEQLLTELKSFQRHVNITDDMVGEYLIGYYFCRESVVLNHRCQRVSARETCDDIIDDVIDIRDNHSSFDCLFCKFDQENNAVSFDIRIECTMPIEYWLFPDVMSLLEAAEVGHCNVEFVPTGVVDERTNVKIVDKCVDYPWLGILCNHSSDDLGFETYKRLFSIPLASWNMLQEYEEPTDVPTCDGQECGDVFCSEFHYLKDDACVSNYGQYLYVIYKMQLAFMVASPGPVGGPDTGNSSSSTTLMEIGEVVSNELLMPLQSMAFVYLDEIKVFTDTPCDDGYDEIELDLTEGISIQVDISIGVYFTDNVTGVEEYLVGSLQVPYMLQSQEVFLMPAQSLLSADGPDNSFTCLYQKVDTTNRLFIANDTDLQNLSKIIKVDRFLLCPLTVAPDSDFVRNETSGYVMYLPDSFNFMIPDFMFLFLDDKIIMCYDDFLMLNFELPSLFTLISLIDKVLSGVSIVCVGITFLIYLLSKNIRSTADGKNCINLAFSLMSVMLSLKLIIWIRPHRLFQFCSVAICLVHYFWLASFCALNVCIFHLHRALSFTGDSVPVVSRMRIYVYYLVTYLTPLVCAILIIIVYLILSDGSSVGYGDTLCYSTEDISSLDTAIILCPIIFTLITSGITFVRIYTAEQQCADQDGLLAVAKLTFYKYIRLSVIFCISGPFMVLDGIHGMTLYALIGPGFTFIIGFSVFVMFVLNKRIFDIFRQLRG